MTILVLIASPPECDIKDCRAIATAIPNRLVLNQIDWEYARMICRNVE